MKTCYTVETLRAGQERPYGDSVYEYLVTVQSSRRHKDAEKLEPWLKHGDVEKQIARDEADRKAGRMSGGHSPESLRKSQRDWCKSIVKALCCKFREKGDNDGIEEESADAHFAPTLKSLQIDPIKGQIRARIVSAYTD